MIRQASRNASSTPLVDPRTRFNNDYTLPDQGFPGLQSNFDPRPDSGETSYVGTGRLRGRRALITGGDSGIGRAVAIAYAREGADIVINYLAVEEPDAQEVVALVEAEGRRIITIPGDITNETFCADLVERAAAELGGLDILVNNAGYAHLHPFIGNQSTAEFDLTFKTNVYAPFFITRAAVPIMPPGSAIVFTASGVAARPPPGLLDYAATKAVLVSFTKSLALQLFSYGIRVNAVAPGLTVTNFLSSQGDNTESIRMVGAETPAGRMEQPVELAPLFVVLAESSSSYTSGSVYAAGGGTGDF